MKKTFLALAFAVAAMCSAFAAPPGNVTNPVNFAQATVESTQAATHSATPALTLAAKDLNPVFLAPSAGKALTGDALAERLRGTEAGNLRRTEGWDDVFKHEGSGHALAPDSNGSGGGSGCAPAARRM